MNPHSQEQSHPSDADWMLWLYEEADADLAESCRRHLAVCSECHAKVSAWTRSMDALTHWNRNISPSVQPSAMVAKMMTQPELPTSPAASPGGTSSSFLRYLIAASIVVLAFTAGRGFGSKPDLTQLRADIKAELRGELLQEMSMSLRSELSQLKNKDPDLVPLIQTESGRIVSATLANWAQQNSQNEQQLETLLTGILQNQVTLRQDLETLAIQAEAQILRTRRELLRLAMENESDSSPGRPILNENPNAPEQELQLNQPISLNSELLIPLRKQRPMPKLLKFSRPLIATLLLLPSAADAQDAATATTQPPAERRYGVPQQHDYVIAPGFAENNSLLNMPSSPTVYRYLVKIDCKADHD